MEFLQLSVNKQKELVFPGLGTAGYMWKYILDDDKKLKIEKRIDTTQPINKHNVGASRNEIFTFTGLLTSPHLKGTSK